MRISTRGMLGVLALLALARSAAAQSDHEHVPAAVLAALRDTLAARYVNPIGRDSLARFRDADSLIYALLDRHTVLLSPDERSEFQVQTGAAFGGIGARLGTRRDTTLIVTVEPGSPAERAGLKPFDRLVSVGGIPVVGVGTDSIVSLVRGQVGTPVGLGIRRGLAGTPVQQVVIRASVQVPSVPAGALLPNGVGVVRIAQFGPQTTQELVEALDWMVRGEAKALILDLRGNPGGVLEEALQVAQLFLPRGTALVEVRGRPGTPVERPRTGVAPRYPRIPLALLVDEGSASASEVLAGALQEAHRAVIAGRQSFGKGSVQQVAGLPEGWAVKLTIARWYTPSGRRIDRGPQPAGVAIDPTAPHDGGVRPDLPLAPDTSSALVAEAARAAGPGWDSLNLAILDWVQAAADTQSTLTPEFEVDSATADALLRRAGIAESLPAGTAAATRTWVARTLTRGAIGARFGVMQDGAWALMHDREVARVADTLLARH